MKKIICSFASNSFVSSLNRLALQIKKISFFDEFFLISEGDLTGDFKSQFSDILNENVRGFGYWVWKPFIIKKILSNLNEGDTLLYIDAGCHINYKGRKRLTEYYNLLEKSETGILAFQQPRHQYVYGFFRKKTIKKNYFIERNWTKGDVLEYYNVKDKLETIDTAQVLSGIIFIKKNAVSTNIINEWFNTYRVSFNLLDDTPSKSQNLDGFIQNRHDQSVFSILCKKNNVDLLSSEEVEGTFAIVSNNPILAIRDIGNRMPYSSFNLLRLTRIAKSPLLLFKNNKPARVIKHDENNTCTNRVT